MPTPSDWLKALTIDQEIDLVSSHTLIADVRRQQASRAHEFTNQSKTAPPMKAIAPVPKFNPSRLINIKPIHLLHALGRITTPPVPNLADLSSTWAILRYVWAFNAPTNSTGNSLVLSETARKLDFHQKALLSDEIGIGMAYYIMMNYFRTSHAVDVSVALETNKWNIVQRYPVSPDYLFFDNPAGPVYIVECKGNQTSYSASLNQLRRGTEQVPSITFADGRRSNSLVIATCMLNQETKIYIVDPPDKEESDWIEANKESWQSQRDSKNQWRINNDKQFVSDLRLISRAKLFSFCGVYREALSQLPSNTQKYWTRFLPEQPLIERATTNQGHFRGFANQFNTMDGLRATFFRGIQEELSEKLSIPPANEEERIRKGGEDISVSELYSKQFGDSPYLSEIEDSPRRVVIRSVCSDGTMMQLTIEQ